MKYSIVLLLMLTGCASDPHQNNIGQTSEWDSDVEVYGALRKMFHQGQTQSMVNLAGLNKRPGMYAVGALEDLSGEVTAYDGQLYLSYPEGPFGRSLAPTSTTAGATLLVIGTAEEWIPVTTGQTIRFDQLDQRIKEMAGSVGMDLESRFPFRIEGRVDDLQYHIIDGSRLKDGGTSHQDHLAASVQIDAGNTDAKLIGFYSKHDERVFTHMGSTTHLHCILEQPLATGHVDHVTLPAGTVIQFPLR